MGSSTLVAISLILVAVVLGLFLARAVASTRFERIGSSPRRVSVIRVTGHPDRVQVGQDSSFAYDLDPEEALALAGLLEDAVTLCQSKMPEARRRDA